jgi:hypothetical protein
MPYALPIGPALPVTCLLPSRRCARSANRAHLRVVVRDAAFGSMPVPVPAAAPPIEVAQALEALATGDADADIRWPMATHDPPSG